MRDKRKPIAFGAVMNIPPAYVDGVFWANDGKVDSAKFYANGRELNNPVADYPDIVDLMAAHVPAGAYATCSAFAAIKFGSHPDKLVTADIVNTGAGMFLPPELEPGEDIPGRTIPEIITDVTQQARAQLSWAARDDAGNPVDISALKDGDKVWVKGSRFVVRRQPDGQMLLSETWER